MASGIPVTIIQIRLIINENALVLYSTFLPNGNSVNPAYLKHWIPIGIPITVMHQRKPARHQLN